MKLLNPATCTTPLSAVQQPSYSSMTSSKTSTDKTDVPLPSNYLQNKPLLHLLIPTLIKWMWNKLKHLFLPGGCKSPLTAKLELIQLAKQLLLWTFPLTLTSKMSPLMNFCEEASCFQLDKKIWTPSKWHHCLMTSPGSLHLD